MLYCNNLEEIVFSRNEILPNCDEFVIISGYVGPEPVKKLKEINIRTTVVYGMYASDGLSLPLKKALLNAADNNNHLQVLCSSFPVHSKCYVWKNKGAVVHALVGSANFSANGLTTPYKEVLAETTKDTFNPLSEYIAKILASAIPCSQAQTKNQISPRPSVESNVDLFTNPNICPMSMLIKKEDVWIVPPGSGINWGHAEGSHVAQDDAYIPISADMVRHYPELFPMKQEAPKDTSNVPRLDHRQNDCIDIIWDDGTTMTGLLEGSRTISNLSGKYPKQISTSPSKSELGKYLRKRLGLKEGSFVTKEDFDRYGRSSIDVSLQGEGIYYFDFSV